MTTCSRFAFVTILLGVSLLAACASTTPATVADEPAATPSEGGAVTPTALKPVQVSDIPLPRESRVDESASLVIGSGDRWVGRLVLRVKTNAAETYGYYFNGMPRLGWKILSAVQSKVSALTFTNGDRVANLQIEGGVGGSTVTVVVSMQQIETQ